MTLEEFCLMVRKAEFCKETEFLYISKVLKIRDELNKSDSFEVLFQDIKDFRCSFEVKVKNKGVDYFIDVIFDRMYPSPFFMKTKNSCINFVINAKQKLSKKIKEIIRTL